MTQYPQQNGVFLRTYQDAKRDLKVSQFSSLRHVRVCNQEMVAVVNDRTVVHRSLAESSKQSEIQLPISASDSIVHLHLSPSGFHTIASCKSGDNYYINLKNNAPVALKKVRDVISAVGWNPDAQKDTETGHILLGTVEGSILETNISSNGVISFVKEHVSRFGGDKELASTVSDIVLYVINDEDPKATKYVLFICQSGRLHYIYSSINTVIPAKSNYMSSASLQTFVAMPEVPQHIFHSFFSSKDSQQTCLSMPVGFSKLDGTSSLFFYSTRRESTQPFRFVWLGPNGYTIGKVNLAADKPRDILEEEKHLEHRRIEGRVECPIAVSMTEYHVLLAYSTRLIAISVHTYAVVFEDIWPQDYGCTLGMTFDPVYEFHWLYTASSILKYRPNDETRYVWRVFLDSGDYAKALMVARDRLDIDPEAHQLVLKRQADKHIAEKNFTAAAEILSQSNESFETVVVKFLSSEEDRRTGLKTLLEKKLEKLSATEDRMKRDALVMWLLEVQLAELAECRRQASNDCQELVSQLQRFLTRKSIQEAIVVNRDAVYKLMVSHADFDTQLFLALHMKDTATTINIYLLREQYTDVLELLKQQASPEWFYEYGPQLVEHIPMELVTSLVNNERVKPQRMLPTLYLCQKDTKMAISAIRYLEWAVRSPAASLDVHIHNLLLQMYAMFRPSKLHDYLESYGRDKTSIPYDLEFAMRTCEQYKLDKSTVFLYCVSELFSEAVEIALKVSVDLAISCARMMDASEDDVILGIESKFPKEQRRRIWLKIAAHVIEVNQDTGRCIELLKESGEVISIQDIFPYFPDFTKIEHFKDSLCDCLKDHSNIVQDIQQSLKEATQVAQDIRERSERLKSRVTVVKAGDHCSVCSKGLAGRPFYPFACRHFYHRECLEQAMTPFLSLESKKRLADLISRERRVLAQLDLEEKSGSKAVLAEREARFEEISEEISQILGNECPLCGFIAIDLVDKPFFSDVDFANDADSWII